ncbi:MAG: hypothetical protein ABSC42_10770 [Tepidisphaeraceae bacterium]|jgi:hypothetical protein
MSDERSRLPTRSAGDAAVAVVRAIVGSVPYVGPASVELFNWFVKAPHDRRLEELIELFGETLADLQANRGIDLRTLQNNPAFFDVLMQAIQIGLRNHQTEKREGLRNAIANSAVAHAPSESKRQMFLHFIDVFTVWHLKLLAFFANPQAYLTSLGKGLPQLGYSTPVRHGIEIAFPDLQRQQDFYDQIWSDLRQRGLVITQPPPGTVTISSPGHRKQTTALGDEFLNFITTPKPDSELTRMAK